MNGSLRHLQAVVFDWAGTMIDHGSLAPMRGFVEAFRRFGVEITDEEARGPMGITKRSHVAALLALPRISEAWRQAHGRAPGEADVDAVYEAFVLLNIVVAARHADLVPGAAETAQALRTLGLKIGSSTGYTREIMAEVLPIAARQGYAPDCLVCSGDTPEGRPTPFMLYRALMELGAWPAWGCVKVDDTEAGIAEGMNAGCWTVGVSVTGNLFGLSLAEMQDLSEAEFSRRRATAVARLDAAGAHYVIDGVTGLLPVIHAIEGRLARGERP